MNGDIAISVKNLAKAYQLGRTLPTYRTLQGRFVGRLLGRASDEGDEALNRLWALEEVSFDVYEGEVVGIIGRNGAGKSTLLKILSRITEPTAGSATIHGRVGSLLEVGTGFQPELTGRENIFLNGAVLGMKKSEIIRQFDEIVAFSEIEKFIDTPVKRYSSGMYVRLAFAVAAHLDPEIMIVDEVLAVGDIAFQRKCLGKMSEVANSGRTVLFVSHNTGAVQALCTRGILLDQGRIVFDGMTDDAIKEYVGRTFGAGSSRFDLAEPSDAPVKVTTIELEDEVQRPVGEVQLGNDVVLVIEYRIEHIVRDVVIATLVSADGTPLLYTYDTDADTDLSGSREPGVYRTTVRLPSHLFKEGNYRAAVSVGWSRENLTDPDAFVSFEIVNTSRDTTHRSYRQDRPGHLFLELEWKTTHIESIEGADGLQVGTTSG